MNCPNCGLLAQVGWMVCPRCAIQILPVPDPTTPIALAPPARRWRRPYRVWSGLAFTILACLLVSAAIAIVTTNDLATHDQLKTTTSNLAGTTAQLQSAQGQLASTRTSLERANAALATEENQVNDLKQQLSDAQSTIGAAGNLLSALKACLNGLSQSLSGGLSGFPLADIFGLPSVPRSCNEATSGAGAITNS
jgi:hypothetical protein